MVQETLSPAPLGLSQLLGALRRWAPSSYPRYLASRVIFALIVVWGVVTLTFLISRVVSADPSALLVPDNATEATRLAVRHKLGLDGPLVTQSWRFTGDVLHGNLGTSFTTNRPVASNLFDPFPATLELGMVSVLWAIVIGVLVGVLSALRSDSWMDQGLRGLIITAMAMPRFWPDLMLIWLFFLNLDRLPGPIGQLPVDISPPNHITGPGG